MRRSGVRSGRRRPLRPRQPRAATPGHSRVTARDRGGARRARRRRAHGRSRDRARRTTATSVPSSFASARSPSYLKRWMASRSAPPYVPAAVTRPVPRPARRGHDRTGKASCPARRTRRTVARARGRARRPRRPWRSRGFEDEFVAGLRARRARRFRPAARSPPRRRARGPRCATDGSCSATRTTRPSRSTKTASMAKRMSHIVMEDVFVMRRPSPAARLEREIRPMPRERKESATRQSEARTVPLVLFRTRRREART